MSKITFPSVATLNAVNVINSNFSAIANALQNNVLYRFNIDGEPNALVSDIDANNKRIYNLPNPSTNGEPLTLGFVSSGLPTSDVSALSAAASALSAANSATAAAASAGQASVLATQLASLTDPSLGSNLIGYKNSFTGSVGRSLRVKLEKELLSVKDQGAVGDGVTNDSAAFVSASNAAGAGGSLLVPAGNYFINTNTTITAKLVFAGNAKLVIPAGVTVTLSSIEASPASQIFSGLGTVAGLSGRVYAEWWGAKGDGATDDSAAFNSSVGTRRTLVLRDPSAGYKLGSQIVINTANFSILGVDTRTNIIHSGNFDLFAISASDVSIQNLWIDSQNVTSAGFYEFKIKTSVSSPQRLFFKNLISFQSRGFMSDDGGSGTIITLTIRDVVPKKQSGPGFLFTKAFAYIHLHDVTVDFVGSALPSFNAYNFTNGQGILFDNCDVTGSSGAGTGATTSQAGFVLNNCAGVWFRKTQADTVEGRGYELIGCSGVQFYDGIASLCGSGVGFYFKNCIDVTGNIRQSGRVGQSYAPAGIHGVAFDTGNLRIDLDIQSNLSTGDGVNILSPTGLLSGKVQAFSNIGVGLRSDNSGSIHIGVAQFGGNTGGNYNIGGTTHGISRAQLNSGAFSGPLTGPASA